MIPQLLAILVKSLLKNGGVTPLVSILLLLLIDNMLSINNVFEPAIFAKLTSFRAK
jgi:hypothetical protein